MFGAIAHGNEWLKAKDIYLYATFVAVTAVAVTVLVGYPLAKLLV